MNGFVDSRADHWGARTVLDVLSRAEQLRVPGVSAEASKVIAVLYIGMALTRRQIVELVRAGRAPADLAREFEASRQAISHWVARADREEGRREAKPATAETVLVAAEREELVRLRREVRQLRLERDILSKAAAWFARETGTIPSGSSGS